MASHSSVLDAWDPRGEEVLSEHRLRDHTSRTRTKVGLALTVCSEAAVGQELQTSARRRSRVVFRCWAIFETRSIQRCDKGEHV